MSILSTIAVIAVALYIADKIIRNKRIRAAVKFVKSTSKSIQKFVDDNSPLEPFISRRESLRFSEPTKEFDSSLFGRQLDRAIKETERKIEAIGLEASERMDNVARFEAIDSRKWRKKVGEPRYWELHQSACYDRILISELKTLDQLYEVNLEQYKSLQLDSQLTIALKEALNG